MFQINNLSKSYGKKQILKDISFSASNGQAIGILGVNGSGKSTLLSCIAQEYYASDEIKIGYVTQENPLFEELKPIDNIRMWTKLSKKEIISRLNEPPLCNIGVCNFLNTPVNKMSGGMKKRLSLASVMINNPNVLLMDEPFAALDLLAKQDMLNYMNSFIKSGGILIIASHEEEIFNFCSKVYLLKNGSLIDTDSLRSNNVSYLDILRS